MSSYHSSFKYLNKNSKDDFNLIITHFEADNGETDSYLSQEQIYQNTYSGRKRILYGTKWNTVANVKITVVKQNFSAFSTEECRSIYRWLTGKPSASWLDLYTSANTGAGEKKYFFYQTQFGDTLSNLAKRFLGSDSKGDEIYYLNKDIMGETTAISANKIIRIPLHGGDSRYSFLCTCTDVKPQKIDARTVGFNIYFESTSPFAFSPQQIITYSFGNGTIANDNGILTPGGSDKFYVTDDNVLYNKGVAADYFNISEDGAIYLDDAVPVQITNNSDDLYSYVFLDVLFINKNCKSLLIKNTSIGEETKIDNVKENEIIYLSSNQFITTDSSNKLGDNFNFVWPRLAPGVNEFIISSNGGGGGILEFAYRYPIKIGDLAVDIYMKNENCGCNDTTQYGTVSWYDIAGTPETLSGYGIGDAYTIEEINKKIDQINIDAGIGIDEIEFYNIFTDTPV